MPTLGLVSRLVAMIALLILASPAHAAPTPTLHRFALVVGSSAGDGTREQLRYAAHDAITIADVLKQLGGVSDVDLTLLREPDPRALDAAFDAFARQITAARKAGQRVELLFYYSGHADETGLLLARAHYDYAQLRRRIRDVPADVHIAIVDSCASGSFTRMKGGVHAPPFLRDGANQVEGFAFLSSSAADEDAQESDRIGASFFTYYFVAALRGAADRNRDGKITLTEAYQFAYDNTLGRTQSTTHGPQHPAYDMHLSGTGDVVMTDLRATESALVLPPALKGRVTIVDKGGRVAVELTKDAGEPLVVALPSETYAVHVDNKDGTFVATVTIDRAGELPFAPDSLRRIAPEATVARGSEHHLRADPDDDDEVSWKTIVPVDFGGGVRVERPVHMQPFDALVTFGGTSREVRGNPVVGVAETGDFALGFTVGDHVHFAYDTSFGFGPGVFLGDALQVGATIGFGFSGITGGVLDFAWKVPVEAFAVLQLGKDIRPMVYYRESYLFSSSARQNGAPHAMFGDELDTGAGLRFSGRLDGFVYGSMREMRGERYWGVGLGAIF